MFQFYFKIDLKIVIFLGYWIKQAMKNTRKNILEINGVYYRIINRRKMENVYVSIYLKIDLKIAQFPTLFSSAIELKTFDAKNGRKNILGICGIHYRIINCGGKCFDFKIARFPKYRIKRPMRKM